MLKFNVIDLDLDFKLLFYDNLLNNPQSYLASIKDTIIPHIIIKQYKI